MMSGGNISLGDIEAGSYAAVRKEVEVTEGGGIDRMTGRTTNKDGLDLSSLRVDVVEHDEADEGIDTGNPAIHPSIKKTMSCNDLTAAFTVVETYLTKYNFKVKAQVYIGCP